MLRPSRKFSLSVNWPDAGLHHEDRRASPFPDKVKSVSGATEGSGNFEVSLDLSVSLWRQNTYFTTSVGKKGGLGQATGELLADDRGRCRRTPRSELII
jgi:hypothetical protein